MSKLKGDWIEFADKVDAEIVRDRVDKLLGYPKDDSVNVGGGRHVASEISRTRHEGHIYSDGKRAVIQSTPAVQAALATLKAEAAARIADNKPAPADTALVAATAAKPLDDTWTVAAAVPAEAAEVDP